MIRRLLICSKPKTEVEKKLKDMYLKRVREMFKKTLNMESIFNAFDEVFHGLAKTSLISEDLNSFYESLLTITSYYQHSQSGRGNLVAKLLEELGPSEEMEFEFTLNKLPRLLKQPITLNDSILSEQRFDIMNKIDNNLVFCESKMKVYSGCTAGRIELMEKFGKFCKFLIDNSELRNCIKNGGIINIFLIGGVLFDIQGDPATIEKDEDFALCFNGLIRGKNELINTLKSKNVEYSIDDNRVSEKAFIIKFVIDELNVNILFVYGNEVISKLFIDNQTNDIGYFKNQLEGMLYDDLWLGQVITMSERNLLAQNFKKNKILNNYVISMLKNNEVMSNIKKFRAYRNEKVLEEIVPKIIEILKNHNFELLEIKPIQAEIIMNSVGQFYDTNDYVADIIQFLSCENVANFLTKFIQDDNESIKENEIESLF